MTEDLQSIKLIHALFKDLDALSGFYTQKSNDDDLELIEEHLKENNDSLNDGHAAYYE